MPMVVKQDTSSRTQGTSYTAMEATAADFTIGNRDAVIGGHSLEGNVSEAAVWSTALTSTNVKAL